METIRVQGGRFADLFQRPSLALVWFARPSGLYWAYWLQGLGFSVCLELRGYGL